MDIENEENKAGDGQPAAPQTLLTTSGEASSTPSVELADPGLAITTERISTGDELPKTQHPNDVRFKVKYAKDYKGDKTFKDGDIQIVSKESAEHFAKVGIGTIIK